MARQEIWSQYNNKKNAKVVMMRSALTGDLLSLILELWVPISVSLEMQDNVNASLVLFTYISSLSHVWVNVADTLVALRLIFRLNAYFTYQLIQECWLYHGFTFLSNISLFFVFLSLSWYLIINCKECKFSRHL